MSKLIKKLKIKRVLGGLLLFEILIYIILLPIIILSNGNVSSYIIKPNKKTTGIGHAHIAKINKLNVYNTEAENNEVINLKDNKKYLIGIDVIYWSRCWKNIFKKDF